ncbi:MAG TPA: N-6 DNA methylase [Hymenobacter sp.]
MLKLTPEERVRQEFIHILLTDYHFIAEQMAQEVKVSNSKRGQGNARADIVIWRSKEDRKAKKSPVIVVECKAQQVTIREEDYYQGMNYAAWAGADFFVTTNQKETKFFRVVKGEIPKRLDEITAIPNAAEVGNEKKIQALLTQTKQFTRDDFSRLLFKCHNIIRNNDKLSPEAAFDEISKILFMKIRYEREQARKRSIFSRAEFEELQRHDAKVRPAEETRKMPFYQYLFEQTKRFFAADELFETTDTLKIREASFLQIVKELEKYNLSDTSDDVKGIAFEKFLGNTFRGELGQFFTPRPVVDYIVDILDPQEGETICDPCCGSGGFLIKAFEYVRDHIERHVQAVKEKVKEEYFTDEFNQLPEAEQEATTAQVEELFGQLNAELDLQNPESRLRRLSYDCIFGTDANPRMARTAKMNMIMHGDGHGGVHHHDGLLNVNGIFDGRFDVILTNPPFGSRVDKKLEVQESDLPTAEKLAHYTERYGPDYAEKSLGQCQDKVGESVLDLFDIAKETGQSQTEVLFLERCLNLLRPGGRMGVVLPEGVLNSSSLQRVREFIEDRAKLLNVTSIPQDVFMASGATVKPSVVFLKKFTDEEATTYAALQAEEHATAMRDYGPRLDALKTEYDARRADYKDAAFAADRKALDRTYRQQKAELEERLAAQVRQAVKQRFSYPVPMVEVENAGISSTGTVIENELVPVAQEFRQYRLSHRLWQNRYELVKYHLPETAAPAALVRIMLGEDTPAYGRALEPANF